MMSAKRFLLVSAASLFLVAVMALNVQPQGPARGYHPNPNATPLPTPAPAAQPDMQPMWAVNGMIRWRQDYGVVPVSVSLRESMNNRCISFYVAALDPRTNQPLRGDHSQMWKGEEYRDHYGRTYYVCRYALKLPANRQVRVIASMGGDGLLPATDPNPLFLTNRWIGGARDAAPPAGSMRTFTGSRYVTLDQKNPRATVDFELIYAAPRSDNPR
jgi:hypothetical protein